MTTAQPLTDAQRKRIHDFALDARDLLTRDISELLEGIYGLHSDSHLEPPDKLPQVQRDPEAAETYRRLAQFMDDEARAGLPRAEAVEKLVKEAAFTHLNRLVAFKMMEARRLIRGTVDKGPDSNAFKYYLADPAHADDLARYNRGEVDAAYRRFLLWQAGQVAQEVRVLFDPEALPSRLFPRPRALNALLAMLNAPELADAWRADETIGWIYQFFNEREKAEVFERLYKQKQKIRRQDIPAATQLFTPNWIVRFLVQNTLGRLWVQMHPDSRLVGTDLLDYLVPLTSPATSPPTSPLSTSGEGESGEGEALKSPSPLHGEGDLGGEVAPGGEVKPVKDITLLDPACGTMHFGLVAFDLFAAMYQEEIDRAGEPGWPAAPSVGDPADIPAAIIQHNLFGIDIDLRAVQLSALALYLKAKALNPEARITRSNLACADVLPLNGARLGAFLRDARFTRPVYERLIRRLWERLKDASELGSLLRLEREIGALVEEERAGYARTPLFAGVSGEFEREAAEAEFWDFIGAQIVQALDEFTRQQAAAGADATFFAGEAVKGLRLADLMLRRYDVVVTNPPYSGKRNLGEKVADYLDDEYPDAKGDLYAAFIQRCGEWTDEGGRLGMITQQSFMFLSSYERLRANLRAGFAVEAMAHTGPRAFAEISGEKVNTTVFSLRKDPDAPRRENTLGTYYRLVNAPEGDGKRLAFEQALRDGSNTYRVAQRRFDAIPGSPWVYWVSENIRDLFEVLPSLGDIAQPRQGLATADNARFLRSWWEIGTSRIGLGHKSRVQAQATGKKWFPYMKGGEFRKWYGNQEHVVNWQGDGQEIQNLMGDDGRIASRPQNTDYYFREGITWTDLGAAGFSARVNPGGFIFDVSGSCAFPQAENEIPGLLAVMNAGSTGYLLSLLNPTMHFQVGDVARLPVPNLRSIRVEAAVETCIRVAKLKSTADETTFDLIAPPRWPTGLDDLAAAEARLAALEREIDDEVYRLYGISDEDRAAIEAELSGGAPLDDGEDDAAQSEDEGDEVEAPMSREELAVRWISYAVGVVLGRFVTSPPPTSGRRPLSTQWRGGSGDAVQDDSASSLHEIESGPGGEVKHATAPPELWEKLKPLARQMRRDPTPAEERLWQRLRDRQASGHKFRRQHAIERFIVDFYCAELGLIVEVDGPVHEYSQQEDAVRQAYLEALGYRVLRFTNDEVLQSVESVVEQIAEAADAASGSPSPRVERGLGGEVSGEVKPLGRAVYRRDDFAVGSLPAPDEAEFDELVGPARFAYVDAEGGRHLFPAEVEAALRALAVPDGITVLDEGHPRDLPALVMRALALMLGEAGAAEVVEAGAGGDLRRFLSRDYFTKWHLKWYRKRPVYWPLQSSRRSYGFVLFHERVERVTLYVLQRDYLDYKLNAVRQRIEDLEARRDALKGSARRQVERQIDDAAKLLDELTEFAKTMARVVREGYEPAPDWIDDGVILRLAPLWELIPLWKSEPKKYWERLQRGDFDWSRIAMRYWPDRVREACKTNKSFAIAHGHEEWYEEA